MAIDLRHEIKTQWSLRPWWMNVIMAFCIYMAVIYMPFDLFWKDVASDEEVWFGITLHGWWAKLTAPLHWVIYAGLAYGFWRMRAWMWPWAAVYCAQISIGMLVWSLLDPRGGGLVFGLVGAAVFLVPTVALWSKKSLFGDAEKVASTSR